MQDRLSIDWQNPPFLGQEYPKNFTCIFNPPEKISFPAFLVQMCLFNRERFIKTHKKIPRGSGWSTGLGSTVRLMMMQAYVICGYFLAPHIEPLVGVAFKNYFRSNRVFKLGTYKKNRKNISIDEKELIKGISVELSRLKNQRDIFSQVAPQKTEVKAPEDITFSSGSATLHKKSTLADLIELEKRLKSNPPVVDISLDKPQQNKE